MGLAVAKESDEGLDVVWGLGSGRRARALLREGRRVEVLALDVDPSRPDLARAVIGACARLTAAHASGRLRVMIGAPESFAQRWRELGSRAELVTVHVDLGALSAVPAPAQELARVVERVHLERDDLVRFARVMHDNLVENIDAIAEASPLSAWSDAARGRPAFVLAAGPSARSAMPWLERARALGPVIAVDTALPLCRSYEVPVDCLVSVDPHATSRVHLGTGTADVHALAFQPFCAPAIVDAFPRRFLATPQGDRLCDRAAALLNLPAVPIAGTVLLYALQVAATLGCSPVILIGADFAHVGGQTHALGTATARSASPCGGVVNDARGAPVPTTSTLLRFLHAVERHVRESEAPHWVVDGGGAHVQGTRVVDPVAIERWVRRHTNGGASAQPLRVPEIADGPTKARRGDVWRALVHEFDAI